MGVEINGKPYKEFLDDLVKQKLNEMRCETCDNWRGYVNAKVGRGLCVHFMHETHVNGFCYKHKDKE